jgi:hypothetical protein
MRFHIIIKLYSKTFMSKSPKINANEFPEQIPICYNWFGKEVPEDYMISLASYEYPLIF